MTRVHPRRRANGNGNGNGNGAADGAVAADDEFDLDDDADDGDDGARIVKTKRFSAKPMDPEEAALQMDLLGHSFFLFTNTETGNAAVLTAATTVTSG